MANARAPAGVRRFATGGASGGFSPRFTPGPVVSGPGGGGACDADKPLEEGDVSEALAAGRVFSACLGVLSFGVGAVSVEPLVHAAMTQAAEATSPTRHVLTE